MTDELLEQVLGVTRPHWQRWRFCYESGGSFSKMPLLTDPVRFQGFLYEFSVGRGLELAQVVPIMEDLREVAPELAKSPVRSVLDGIEAALLRVPKENNEPDNWTRISLASKLLALWRPAKHPMWDRYVRRGLSEMHGRQTGHRYTQTSVETYEVFQHDFFHLHDRVRARLAQRLTNAEQSCSGFSERYLDQVLLQLGRPLLGKKLA